MTLAYHGFRLGRQPVVLMRAIALVGLAAFACGMSRAQVSGDGWLISSGGVSSSILELRFVGGQYWIVSGFGAPEALPWISGSALRPAADRQGEIFFLAGGSGTNGQHAIMSAHRTQQGTYSLRYVLNPVAVLPGFMDVAGDHLWSVEWNNSQVFSLPTWGATQRVLRGDLSASLGATGWSWGAATDGREVFFGIGDSIYAVDTQATAFAPRIVASQVMPYVLGMDYGLAMGPARSLLVGASDKILEVDIDSGAVSIAIPTAQMRYSPSPLATYVAYNPWTDEVAYHQDYVFIDVWCGPLRNATSNGWTIAWTGIYPQQWVYGLSTTAEIPFQYVGRGCLTSAGREPRMLWSGVPLQGANFSLSVRRAEPNGVAILWIGTSETHWPGVGALPLDLGLVGAPGCTAYASADFSLMAPTDGSGLASFALAVPVNSVLHGMPFFCQTASLTSGNALGLVTSDAVAGRIR